MATQVTNDRSPPQMVPVKPVSPSGEVQPTGAADPAPKEVEVKAQAPAPETEPSVSDVVSQMAQVIRRELNFALDETSGKTVIKIIDSESRELVRQIPSEELLALARRLHELSREQFASGEQLKGLLVTTKV